MRPIKILDFEYNLSEVPALQIQKHSWFSYETTYTKQSMLLLQVVVSKSYSKLTVHVL